MYSYFVHKVLIWFWNFAVNVRIVKQARNRENLWMFLMKFSVRHILCYDYISLTFCSLSSTVVWFRMRMVCVVAYESTMFIEFRLILSVISENNEQQNYFLLVCDKLLNYHVDMKCFSFNIPPQFYVTCIRKYSYSALLHGMAVYKCVHWDSSFLHSDDAVFSNVVFVCNSTIFYYAVIVIIIPILC